MESPNRKQHHDGIQHIKRDLMCDEGARIRARKLCDPKDGAYTDAHAAHIQDPHEGYPSFVSCVPKLCTVVDFEADWHDHEDTEQYKLETLSADQDVGADFEVMGRGVIACEEHWAWKLHNEREDIAQDEEERYASSWETHAAFWRKKYIDEATERHVVEGSNPDRGENDEGEHRCLHPLVELSQGARGRNEHIAQHWLGYQLMEYEGRTQWTGGQT